KQRRSWVNRLVRTSLKVSGVTLFALALVLAVTLTYSTARGYTSWWFGLSGRVTVDGVPNGYMHRIAMNSAVIITRTDLSPRQSYLVGLSGKKSLIHCGEWHAPRLPAFPIGDVNPPCNIF